MIHLLVLGVIAVYIVALATIIIKHYGDIKYWDGFNAGQRHERNLRKMFTTYEG